MIELSKTAFQPDCNLTEFSAFASQRQPKKRNGRQIEFAGSFPRARSDERSIWRMLKAGRTA